MSFVKNSVLNLIGYALPAIVAIPVLGFLARELGTERFGLFTLAIALVGYASVFDFGMTRAVIREVSIYRNNHSFVSSIISTASICVFILGAVAMLIAWGFSSKITSLLNVTPALSVEMSSSVCILVASVPVLLLNQVWISKWEGVEDFFVLNLQKIISGLFVVLLPALFVLYKASLISAVLGLCLSRYFSLLLTWVFIVDKSIFSLKRFDRTVLKKLINTGGWMTISNIVSPLMSYFDRFFISSYIGADKIAFYSAPSEAISRLNIIPFALIRATFPKLSNGNAINRKRTKSLAYILMVFSVGVFCSVIGVFSKEIMLIWLGEDFLGLPVNIFRILLVGYFFNSIAQIPFASLQASGYSKITAYLHLCELVPYVVMLYFLVCYHSILGAALAWSVRMIVDFIVLFLLDNYLVGRAGCNYA